MAAEQQQLGRKKTPNKNFWHKCARSALVCENIFLLTFFASQSPMTFEVKVCTMKMTFSTLVHQVIVRFFPKGPKGCKIPNAFLEEINQIEGTFEVILLFLMINDQILITTLLASMSKVSQKLNSTHHQTKAAEIDLNFIKNHAIYKA